MLHFQERDHPWDGPVLRRPEAPSAEGSDDLDVLVSQKLPADPELLSPPRGQLKMPRGFLKRPPPREGRGLPTRVDGKHGAKKLGPSEDPGANKGGGGGMAALLGSQGSGEGAQRAELASRHSRGHPCAMWRLVLTSFGLYPAAHCCTAICLVTQPLRACCCICKAGESQSSPQSRREN